MGYLWLRCFCRFRVVSEILESETVDVREKTRRVELGHRVLVFV